MSNESATRHHNTAYLAKLGFFYQRRRERFFDLLDKYTKALTVLLGASLLAEYVQANVPVIGALVSAIGLMSLVFGYSDRKQVHKSLAEEYAVLLTKIEGVGASYVESDLNLWQAELQRLNAKEPPTLGTLVVLCQNEIAVAMGQAEFVKSVRWYKSFFANWWDFKVAT